jgi:uncharacterized protein (TIGR02452 family)
MITRYERVKVAQDTINQCTTGKHKDLKIGDSELFTGNDSKFSELKVDKKFVTTIDVLNWDVLLIAESLFRAGDTNLLVLNLASPKHFGGGWLNGSLAQEEELFRRSNYFTTDIKNFYRLSKMESVYTSNVMVIKDEKYKDLEYTFPVAMLAVTGIINPVTDNNKLNSWDYHVTFHTIDNIFRVALLKKHDVLVLGALGCGVFKNPTEEIVKIYNTCLEKYNGCFRKIVFAVLSRNDNNFDIFNKGIKRVF